MCGPCKACAPHLGPRQDGVDAVLVQRLGLVLHRLVVLLEQGLGAKPAGDTITTLDWDLQQQAGPRGGLLSTASAPSTAWSARTGSRSSRAPGTHRRMAAISSLPNICLAAPAPAPEPSTVRPEVSMRWMTRWSSTAVRHEQVQNGVSSTLASCRETRVPGRHVIALTVMSWDAQVQHGMQQCPRASHSNEMRSETWLPSYKITQSQPE